MSHVVIVPSIYSVFRIVSFPPVYNLLLFVVYSQLCCLGTGTGNKTHVDDLSTFVIL